MFSKQLIEYTEKTFKEETITIRTKTMVKNVTDKYIEAGWLYSYTATTNTHVQAVGNKLRGHKGGGSHGLMETDPGTIHIQGSWHVDASYITKCCGYARIRRIG